MSEPGYDDYTVLFFSIWQPLPVFHGYERGRGKEADGASRDWTRCGLMVSEYADGRLTVKGTSVPVRHAVKFGRPCRKCFPAGEGEA